MTKTNEKTGLLVKKETRPETNFEKFFRHLFSLMTPSVGLGEFPSVDIFEEGNYLVLKAELLGIQKNNLNVTITENRGS